MKKLAVSEQFYSIQGEGPTTGVPALFLRLSGCNLMCGGAGTEKDGKLHDGATWRCDSIEVWRKGEALSFDAVLFKWQSQMGSMDLAKSLGLKQVHLVFTGGEPLLHQAAICDFMQWIREELNITPYVEIETNGTILPSFLFDQIVDQYNISPKLSNSGMSRQVRIVDDAMKFFATRFGSWFKFVISDSVDLAEVKLFKKAFNLDSKRIYLMPAADNLEALRTVSIEVAEYCKGNGFRFSSRLQVAIWDKKTGV